MLLLSFSLLYVVVVDVAVVVVWCCCSCSCCLCFRCCRCVALYFRLARRWCLKRFVRKGSLNGAYTCPLHVARSRVDSIIGPAVLSPWDREYGRGACTELSALEVVINTPARRGLCHSVPPICVTWLCSALERGTSVASTLTVNARMMLRCASWKGKGTRGGGGHTANLNYLPVGRA